MATKMSSGLIPFFKSLSTFQVEMCEMNTILRQADENSLILGDELCSGTESISALSLITASIEELSKKGTNFLFSTHLHQLSDMEELKQKLIQQGIL